MSTSSEKVLSLAEHFDAPDDYIGSFGWICGYSADDAFLNNAATRFTGRTKAQRAHWGHIALVIMLDPSNKPISLLETPSVAHILLNGNSLKPFRLLHAKVALLGFKHQKNSDNWKLRLIVSTGNWTRQTVEESIDLVWRIDISSEDLRNKTQSFEQYCTEIKASWNLLSWLQEFFNFNLLKHNNDNETTDAMQLVQTWVESCIKKAKGQSYFLDNRKSSLLSQLIKTLESKAGTKRNYLAMGSGFYEGTQDNEHMPNVPMKIIESLKLGNLLTKNPEVDIFVNPSACQSIANKIDILSENNITVRPASVSEKIFGKHTRTLHAKFLFSANYREYSNKCANSWVYLGSGNLTNPGFIQKMSSSGGNLEAGVIFFPDTLYWRMNKNTPYAQVISHYLPLQWDDEVTSDSKNLCAGVDWEPSEDDFFAPPITFLLWKSNDTGGELHTTDDAPEDFCVLSGSNECPKSSTGFQWYGEQPREVTVRWDNGNKETKIPVIDKYGRIAATALAPIDIEEAWWQLASFPIPTNDDEDNDEIAYDEAGAISKLQASSLAIKTYPIRQMMEHIENIALKQTQLKEHDWKHWCRNLEQVLEQASSCACVKYFCEELKINPLSSLRYECFRPDFAEDSTTELGKLYDEVLTHIEEVWKCNHLRKIGSSLGGKV